MRLTKRRWYQILYRKVSLAVVDKRRDITCMYAQIELSPGSRIGGPLDEQIDVLRW